MNKCDNYTRCHNPEIIGEDNNALFVYCKECGATQRIGKNKKGNPEHLLYGKWFKRDVLQPPSLLYYKYSGAKGINVV